MTKHTQLQRNSRFPCRICRSFGWKQAEKIFTYSGSKLKPYLKGFPILLDITKTEIALYDVLSTNMLLKIGSRKYYTWFNTKHWIFATNRGGTEIRARIYIIDTECSCNSRQANACILFKLMMWNELRTLLQKLVPTALCGIEIVTVNKKIIWFTCVSCVHSQLLCFVFSPVAGGGINVIST